MRLGIDTSGPWLSLGLVHGTGTPLHSVQLMAGRRHAELLLPELEALMKRTRVRKDQLTGVVTGTGPGSYTGLRVGLAAAAGIARGLGIPHYGADSLAAAAWPLLAEGAAAWITVDARRGNVYAGCYSRTGNELVTVAAPAKVPLAELTGRASDAGIPIVRAGPADATWLAMRAAAGQPPDAVYL